MTYPNPHRPRLKPTNHKTIVMTNILIGTPCYGGVVTTEYVTGLLGLQRELMGRGIDFLPSRCRRPA